MTILVKYNAFECKKNVTDLISNLNTIIKLRAIVVVGYCITQNKIIFNHVLVLLSLIIILIFLEYVLEKSMGRTA